MKKTLFLATLLGATLGFTDVAQAEEYIYLNSDRPEFNVRNDTEDVDDLVYWDEGPYSEYFRTSGYFNAACTIEVAEDFKEAKISNGGVANNVVINRGATLTMAQGWDEEDEQWEWGYFWQLPVNAHVDKFPDLLKYNLQVSMYEGSTLDYSCAGTYADLKLGAFNFQEGADITIKAGNLHAMSIDAGFVSSFERNFLINAHLDVSEGTALVMDSTYAKTVTLEYDQTMNLEVASSDHRPFIRDGEIELNLDIIEPGGWGKNYYRMHLDSAEGAKLLLPDGETSHIDSYLGGSATISLGHGTTLQGHDEVDQDTGYRYISWLTNNIEVRENCSALMTAGYYGGNITMEEGSSLQFYMGLAPAGVDEELWHGGAGVFMKGGNTLDIGGGAHTFALIVEGEGNTVSHGTLLWNESSTGSASITNGSLMLKNDLTMAENATVFLKGDATLDMGGQKRAFGLTVTGDENKLTNGAFIGALTLEEDSTLVSDSAMASWDGPTSIVMNEGSTLEMVPGQGKDICINNPSALQMNGKATINNAYLVLRTMNRPNQEYVLDDGVASLEGSSSYLLPGDEEKERFNLNNHTANFGIIVWESDMASDISIINGKIDKSVLIRNTSGDQLNAKLSLRNVKLGDGAYFTMEDNTQLDLGQAKEEYMVTVQTPTQTASWLQERKGIGLNKFTFTGQSARIDNGTLWVGDHISGDNETVTLGTDLSGTAAMVLDYDQATLKFGGHKWTMTQSNGTELFTMEDNGGYTGAITGRAEIDVDAGTQDKNHVQFKGKAADRPDWVQVQGVKLTTKSDFHMENAVISGSLIDIGEGTTMYLVNVEIKADTRFTDDTAMLDMRNTTAWLEQDVNTYVTGREQMETDTVFSRCGDIWAPTLTIAEGSKGINLTCDMFDSVTLDGTDLWLDMTDIAERGTLLGWDYFTLTFDSMTQEVEQALTYISTLQIFAKLGEDYITNAYVTYSDYAEHDGRASRLFFKLVPTPEPTTSTLSLLALAALAARRRKDN